MTRHTLRLTVRLIHDYLLLPKARASAMRLGDRREAIRTARLVARQRANAAQALWSERHSAEAFRLVADALHTVIEVAERTGEAFEIAPRGSGANAVRWREILVVRGVRSRNLDLIDRAVRDVAAVETPRLDGDVTPTHADVFRRAIRACHAVDHALGEAGLSPAQIARLAQARVAAAVLILTIAFVGLYFALRVSPRITVRASATYADADRFNPSKVVDDHVTTEWLLPDNTAGWVELSLVPPRNVVRVRILNARNEPYFDRATREYTLQFYTRGVVVRSVEGAFDTFERDPKAVTHDVKLERIDRIRFVVRSWHHLGGGLAELWIDE